jgi:XTP/dITP diphosphohydrolase
MNKLLIATKNKGKVREIVDLLKDYDIEVLSLADFPKAPDVVEDGLTFRANALKKAVEMALWRQGAGSREHGKGKLPCSELHAPCLVMGEDSGLEVDALNGRPGVISARYSGEGATDEKNNAKLLQEMAGVPFEKRTARYRSAIALADRSGILEIVEASCEGLIATEPRGTNGFGYDPLFYIPQHQQTFGELPLAVKQTMSHRGKALREMLRILPRHLI